MRLESPSFLTVTAAALITVGCSGTTGSNDDASASDVVPGDIAGDAPTEDASPDSEDAPDTGADPDGALDPLMLTVVTFNTGSGVEANHDGPPDDGYGSEQAEITDEWYGNGLAWVDFVEGTREWFATVNADIVVFQEIFHPGECGDIPESDRVGFVCETWTDGDPTVVQIVLGEGWQVMCNPGKPDKCAAVRRSTGTFAGCDADLCLEGMRGAEVDGCGSGSRVGSAVIQLAAGGTFTLVNVHGTSGVDVDEQECRVRQIDRVFVDAGDGEPLANGDRNLVMGDLNTDPARFVGGDVSAVRWNDFVGAELPFHWISDVGTDAEPSYAGLFNIDHVASDALEGSCVTPGVTSGTDDVLDAVFFDHHPVVCEVTLQP